MAAQYGKADVVQGVVGRKLVPCQKLQVFGTQDLILTCPQCVQFMTSSCTYGLKTTPLACHHYRIVFTDGSCPLNGHPDAGAGLGIATGLPTNTRLSLPVTEMMDPRARRSNQRAELLAAIKGVESCIASDAIYSGHMQGPYNHPVNNYTWIIATDSVYVAKGMTEWLPVWKGNDFRTPQNRIPLNLDLFRRLDDAITEQEANGIEIGFWHIPREYNTLADGLAKQAAIYGELEGPRYAQQNSVTAVEDVNEPRMVYPVYYPGPY